MSQIDLEYAYDVAVHGSIAYIASSRGLKIVDISNPINPAEKSNLSGFSAAGVRVCGNLAYVAAYNNGGLKIINVSNATNPILEGNVSGFSAQKLILRDNFVYIAASEGLKIIDASNTTALTLIGSLEGFEAKDIVLNGDTAYIAAFYDQGLKVVNISNVANPILRVSLTGFTAYGIAMNSNNNLVYIAAATQGLKIFDVSNSTNPTLKGGLNGFFAEEIVLNGNLAYVVGDRLKIIDVSDPTNISEKGSVDVSNASGVTLSNNLLFVTYQTKFTIHDLMLWKLFGAPAQSKCSYQVMISAQNIENNFVYKTFSIRTTSFPKAIGGISDQSITPNSSLDLNIKSTYLFNDEDLEDTLSLTVNAPSVWLHLTIKPFYLARLFPIGSSNNAIVISHENLAYIGGWDGLAIVDVQTPSNPITKGVLGGFVVREIVLINNLAYAATHTGLKIISISDINNPYEQGNLSGFFARGIKLNGYIAYIAASQGLKIIDVSNATNPTLKGSLSGFDAQGITLSGQLAYISASEGLKIVDISNITNPILKGSFSGFRILGGVTLSSNLVYAPSAGLKIIDVSDIANPKLKSSLGDFTAYGMTLCGNLVYVYAALQGLKVIDVSNLNNLTIVGEIEVGNDLTRSTVIKSNKIYVVSSTGLSILDVTNYQLSGTPQSIDVGNYKLKVIATDPQGAPAWTSFIIRVEGGPILIGVLPPQIAPIGKSFYSFLKKDTFFDPNNDVITYDAWQTNNSSLPIFLSFNPNSATFWGTPTAQDKGNYMISIFASDRIIYPPTQANFTLLVQDDIEDKFAIIGRSYMLPLPIPADNDFAGCHIMYGVKLLDDASFPMWLQFNTTTRQLLVAANTSVTEEAIALKVTANDGYGEAFMPFNLYMVKNSPPIMASMIPIQYATAGQPFQFKLPEDIFKDVDGDELQYSADLQSAAGWLRFDANTRMFSGTPSAFTDAQIYSVRIYSITITATDPSHASAQGTFELRLNGPSFAERFVTIGLSVLSGLATAYGYAKKKYLLWNWFSKKKYQKPLELLRVGEQNFHHQVNYPVEGIKAIVVTTSEERPCMKKMASCLRNCTTLRDNKEIVFPPVSMFIYNWLFYDKEKNIFVIVNGGPTRLFVPKDIFIQIIATDNRIAEEFKIKVAMGMERGKEIPLQTMNPLQVNVTNTRSYASTGRPMIPAPYAVPNATSAQEFAVPSPLYAERSLLSQNPNALFAQRSETRREQDSSNEKELAITGKITL